MSLYVPEQLEASLKHAPIGEFQQHLFLGKYTQCPLPGNKKLMHLSILLVQSACRYLTMLKYPVSSDEQDRRMTYSSSSR